MGDMADMMFESCFDEHEMDGWHFAERKELKCNHCKKKNLSWRQVKDQWVLLEVNGSAHTCQGYSPSLAALKELAKETLEESKRDSLWRLHEQAKKRGGTRRMVNLLCDADLLAVYGCFLRDEQLDYDNPDVGKSLSLYKNEIKLLREEILRRMAKK